MGKQLTTGQRIRAWREVRGLSIRRLAEESGLYRSSVHRIETGQQDPREQEVQALAKGLRLMMPEFYDDDALAAAVADHKAKARARKAAA